MIETSTAPDGAATRVGPPAWLVAATAALAIGSLAMALAETNLWMHYLIDAGESISLVGLAFILAAGIFLYSRRRLRASLPLAVPWLLFPVITQGDQIIDNLSINWMRIVTHVLLGLLFATPVAVFVIAVRYVAAPRSAMARRLPGWLAAIPGIRHMAAGRTREGSALLATILFVLEIWVAVRFLGSLMVITLIALIWTTLAYGFATVERPSGHRPALTERFALAILLTGIVVSLGLFVGFKNRPGAYQGSPSYFMDPNQRGAGYQLAAIRVPPTAPTAPADPDAVRGALVAYAAALERLIGGYYILDRNYNYDFHNQLFLRSTPLLPEYRSAGLARVAEAQELLHAAIGAEATARATLAAGDPLTALLDDVASFSAFTFGRAPLLERMSLEFQQTKAGLQHATHIYEGEGKVIGEQLGAILDKHAAVLSSPATAPATREFGAIGRRVHDLYANRIVGF